MDDRACAERAHGFAMYTFFQPYYNDTVALDVQTLTLFLLQEMTDDKGRQSLLRADCRGLKPFPHACEDHGR